MGCLSRGVAGATVAVLVSARFEDLAVVGKE
jgi:hypothetical protein